MPKELSLRLIFVGVFCVGLVMQLSLWFSYNYTDADLWATASQTLSTHVLPSLDGPIPPHPGTSIILPAAGLIELGIQPYAALQITIAILMALGIASIACLCYSLRPKSPWWLGAVIVLLPNWLYLVLTPPSAVASILATLLVLLALRVREEKQLHATTVLQLGICGGILLATRLDTGVMFLTTSLAYLFFYKGSRMFAAAPIALATFAILNPYLWFEPLAYVANFFHQVRFNLSVENGLGIQNHMLYLPALSFAISLFIATCKPSYSSVPRDFLLWIMGTSVALWGVLLIPSYHPSRYFFPIIAIWETVLPILLFDCIERSEFARKKILSFPAVYTIAGVLFLYRAVAIVVFVFLYIRN